MELSQDGALVVLPNEQEQELLAVYEGVPGKVVAVCEHAWQAIVSNTVEYLWIVHEALAPYGRFKAWCGVKGIHYNAAKNAIARRRSKEQGKQLLPAPLLPPPEGEYRCIIIDPPWPMEKIVREERPLQAFENDTGLDYPVMTLREIEALPVRELAAQDGCHLYLWTTHKFLPDALRLMAAWGFRYECSLTWVKPTGITPYSWMYNTEHCLFGRCGNLPIERKGLKLGFTAPVIRHSEKPGFFYDMAVQASPEPRLEMFARQAREGFTVWGNEVSADATADALDSATAP